MERTSVMADPETLDRLRALARDRGTSLAEVVREALDEKAREYRPKPTFIGIGRSGGSDLARTTANERVPPRSWR
jgi:Ribbon-helix-helix protein, copG family